MPSDFKHLKFGKRFGLLAPGELARLTVTLIAGAAGASAFVAAGLPAPILSGSMIGVLVALALRLRPALPDTLRDFAMFLSGCGYGCAITRDMLASVTHYPLSLAVLAIAVALIILLSRLWLMRVARWDATTATFASVPGALSAVLAVAAEQQADMARVVIVQTVRSIVIVVFLPSIVSVAGSAAHLASRPAAGLLDLALILAAGALGAYVFHRLRIVAPILFGAMLFSAALHVGNLAEGFLPLPLADLGFLLLGAYFGTRFTGLTLATLRDSLVHAAASFAITMGIASLAALAVIEIGRVDTGEALVAFAPGGLEAMMAVAGAMGLNPLYVGAHHFGRLIGLNLLLPLVGPWLTRKDARVLDTDAG